MSSSEPIIPDPHDRFFKETFSRNEYAVPFLQNVVPSILSEQIDWSTLHWEEATFLDETLAKRASDLLFSANWKGCDAYLYCLFEHQSASDPRMPLRLLRYMVRIWDRWQREQPGINTIPLIIPVVLFQGRGPWSAPPDLSGMIEAPGTVTQDWKAFVPSFAYSVVDVKEDGVLERFKDWQARHILALLASVILERDEERLETAFDALGALLRSQGDDLTSLRTALTYLFTVSGDIDKDIFQTHIHAIEDKRLKLETMSIAELLKSEGRQEGRQEGRHEDIIEALTVRFGAVPDGLVEAIRATYDDTRLRSLFRAAIQSSSIEEFTKKL